MTETEKKSAKGYSKPFIPDTKSVKTSKRKVKSRTSSKKSPAKKTPDIGGDISSDASGLLKISAADIDNTQFQPRADTALTGDFIKAIEEHGGNFVPVLLTKYNGKYATVFGHRRVAACGILNKPILSIVEELSEDEAWVRAIAENTAREDLSEIELVNSVAKLSTFGFELKEIAGKIGKSEGSVKNYYRTSTVDPLVIEKILELTGGIETSKVSLLSNLSTIDQKIFADYMLEENWSRDTLTKNLKFWEDPDLSITVKQALKLGKIDLKEAKRFHNEVSVCKSCNKRLFIVYDGDDHGPNYCNDCNSKTRKAEIVPDEPVVSPPSQDEIQTDETKVDLEEGFQVRYTGGNLVGTISKIDDFKVIMKYEDDDTDYNYHIDALVFVPAANIVQCVRCGSLIDISVDDMSLQCIECEKYHCNTCDHNHDEPEEDEFVSGYQVGDYARSKKSNVVGVVSNINGAQITLTWAHEGDDDHEYTFSINQIVAVAEETIVSCNTCHQTIDSVVTKYTILCKVCGLHHCMGCAHAHDDSTPVLNGPVSEVMEKIQEDPEQLEKIVAAEENIQDESDAALCKLCDQPLSDGVYCKHHNDVYMMLQNSFILNSDLTSIIDANIKSLKSKLDVNNLIHQIDDLHTLDLNQLYRDLLGIFVSGHQNMFIVCKDIFDFIFTDQEQMGLKFREFAYRFGRDIDQSFEGYFKSKKKLKKVYGGYPSRPVYLYSTRSKIANMFESFISLDKFFNDKYYYSGSTVLIFIVLLVPSGDGDHIDLVPRFIPERDRGNKYHPIGGVLFGELE